MELLHVQVRVNEWEFLYNKWYSYEKTEHAGLSSLFLELAVYLQCNYRGNLEEDYLITMVFWNQKILKFFANGSITFMNLRAVSWEVGWVQMVLKFSTVALSWSLNFTGLIAKKIWESFVFRKRCYWIIVCQVPRWSSHTVKCSFKITLINITYILVTHIHLVYIHVHNLTIFFSSFWEWVLFHPS